ncbi:uncharacterized protein BJ171DRAFT_579380 [Polychytrium aggregatum]|uniref:uncharacterized protein n=1 Tax=Polychytrium aggregatum TaxID=110093 RepID=UPI0022FE7D64|nr:uncharacterized protein BJ171DRAFT_579380 [Polychytrium aggregatum]KAI9207027.1 hypothetical protein BJ171DRAFT_579380 [Polychytrium aggregatum]
MSEKEALHPDLGEIAEQSNEVDRPGDASAPADKALDDRSDADGALLGPDDDKSAKQRLSEGVRKDAKKPAKGTAASKATQGSRKAGSGKSSKKPNTKRDVDDKADKAGKKKGQSGHEAEAASDFNAEESEVDGSNAYSTRDQEPSTNTDLFENEISDLMGENVVEEEWETDLEVDDILKKKAQLNPYESACKVLGIVPASSFASKASGQSEVILKHRGLGPKGAQAIADVLESNTSIQYLDLTDNWIESGGAHIGRALQLNRFLVELNLTDNRLGPEAGREMAEMLTFNGTLKILNLAGNRLTDNEAIHFSHGLKQNSTLQVLNLSHNQIGDIGAIALGSGISSNDVLKELNLGWNHIRMKGIAGFVANSRGNITVNTYNFEKNGLGETGSNIHQLLNQSAAIQYLNISGTRLGDGGITAVAKAIESHGATALFKALQSSSGLKHVGFKTCPVSICD